MKKLLFAAISLVSYAHAQVIDCPTFYPLNDTMLTDIPPQHKGKGMVSQQQLSGAGFTIGEFNGGGDLQGLRKEVKGGYEIDFGMPGPGLKWFVCFYGKNGSTKWWEQLDSKEASCKLKVVNKNSKGLMTATLTCE